MARVTVEDCIQIVPNKFELVLLASKRAKDIDRGAIPSLPKDNDKPTIIALREIAEETISINGLREIAKKSIIEEIDNVFNVNEDASAEINEEELAKDFLDDDEDLENEDIIEDVVDEYDIESEGLTEDSFSEEEEEEEGPNMNSNDSSNVIVRFAPSPTGALHIGSVRTALFNWLYARHCNGKFLLRIEDTDKIRSTQENTNLIFDVLKWLAMDYNDTAIIQSSRLDRHKEVAHELVKNGMAYFCCCSQEELAAKKEVALKEGKAYKYDRNCRDLKHDNKSCPAVIRLKSEILGETTVDDMVQGSVTVDNSQLDDLVLLRSDGTPTYMLSVVVDDHDMNVTHVIRGDDHLTNTFRQIQIYRACGWNIPRFGHIPLIYGPDSAKLSKRHGAVSASEYRDLGYLPEALCNYLLRLGWSHGDSEIISRDEAIEWFDFASVGKSPSRFDINKLNHLNSHYIRQKDDAALFEYTLPFIGRDIDDTTKSKILRGMKGLKERADTIVALAKSCMVYVDAPNSYDEKSNKFTTETHVSLVEKFIDIIESAKDDLEEHSMLESAKEIAILNNVKLVEVAQSLRVAITGTTISPSVFEIISILGKEESILRLNNFVKTFRK